MLSDCYKLQLPAVRHSGSLNRCSAFSGDRAFEFTAALHSYIEVQDISLAKVEGLQGLEFLDKASCLHSGNHLILQELFTPVHAPERARDNIPSLKIQK